MANEALIPLVLFSLFMFAFSLYSLAASGQFPYDCRAPTLVTRFGAAVLYGSIVLTLASLPAALFAAWQLIPWYAAVIGGGLTILMAPLVLQWFSDRFADGRGALIVFSVSAAALAAVLLWLATTL